MIATRHLVEGAARRRRWLPASLKEEFKKRIGKSSLFKVFLWQSVSVGSSEVRFFPFGRNSFQMSSVNASSTDIGAFCVRLLCHSRCRVLFYYCRRIWGSCRRWLCCSGGRQRQRFNTERCKREAKSDERTRNIFDIFQPHWGLLNASYWFLTLENWLQSVL